MTTPDVLDGAEIEKIVARLSAKQEAAIKAMSEQWQRAKAIPASGATLNSLLDYRRDFSTTETALAPPVMLVFSDVWGHPMCRVWQLTKLGLATKAHLTRTLRVVDGGSNADPS